MKVSSDEINAGCLYPDTLQIALRELNDSGFVVLEQILDPAFVNEVNATFQTRFAEKRQQQPLRDQIANGRTFVEMSVPFEPPYSDERLSANPLATQVMEAAMGEIICCFYNTNTA